MPSRFIYITALFLCFTAVTASFAAGQVRADLFGADDLYLNAAAVKSFQSASDEHILVFDDGFNLSLGDNQFKSDRAVVWLKSIITQYRGVSSVEHKVVVCMPATALIRAGRGSKSAGIDLSSNFLTGSESTIAEFDIEGEIFVTADKRIIEDPRQSSLYRDALIATGQLKLQPAGQPVLAKSAKGGSTSARTEGLNVFEAIFGTDRSGKAAAVSPAAIVPAAPRFRYPVNISGVGSEPVRIFKEQTPDGSSVATVLNRFYLWQKQDEEGDVLEFQADSAVIFYSEKSSLSKSSDDPQKLLGDSAVKGIYFSGNCIMTQGQRTIRCAQMYYDFQYRQALAVDSVLKTYSEEMGIPMFLRADKMRQICQGKFAAENVVITSSEFYNPQIELAASSIVATSEDAVDLYGNRIGKRYGRVKMKNVKFRQNDRTFFWLPFLSGPMDWAEIPIKRASFGHDSDDGFTARTEWYMARLLGMREPEGVESTFIYDYFGKRGNAVGTRIIYDRNDYFGNLRTYLIKDKGEDNLSRDRQDIKPDRELRGSAQFQHRHFLPYDWQMTLEASYMSDENYHESFFRSEFLTSKEQETLIHMKRLKDNWAFAVMGKWRINDFYDQMEELPSAQYHLVGQSLFDDKFTLYSDSYAGRFRQRIGDEHTYNISEEDFTAGSSRTELDMPLNIGNSRIVPYVAGTFGYDDRSGFAKGLVDGTNTGTFGSKNVFIGEAGLRASRQFWKVYEDVQSEFWDLNGIRHIIKPYASAAFFAESDKVVEQKNTANIGLLQRWQTKRGIGDKQRDVEWMRLNLDYTWVEDPEDSPRRSDKYSYNAPFVPLAVKSAPDIFGTDAGRFGSSEPYGPQRRSLNADYVWRVSDTMAFMSDMNYDTQSGEVEQFNIGIARYRWPNLSYYIGSRYLRSIEVPGENNTHTEHGSNAFVFAATYKINPRYMVSVTYQYDFDYGRRILREISLIRRYHRVYYGFTFSKDESLDRQVIFFNIWPEGLGSMFSGTGPSLGMDSPGGRDY
ncbi:MAG: hypothetical protein K8R02_07470 [Anaerohalosphaeraceae bacterium]|nr:hypothetical protein [Anaerohalosphaeraceae bacterium]